MDFSKLDQRELVLEILRQWSGNHVEHCTGIDEYPCRQDKTQVGCRRPLPKLLTDNFTEAELTDLFNDSEYQG